MVRYVCTFTITEWGTSGNELPPPPMRSYSYSVLSGDESEENFKRRMTVEGLAIRDLLNQRFEARPKPYSCADSVSWALTPVGSVTELVRQIINKETK